MPRKKENKELLVALLPKKSALDILRTEGWYHIPVESAPKRWPPKALAFYQGKVFGDQEAYKIRHFGEVQKIEIVPRKELFPGDEQNAAKAKKLYYRIQLEELQTRPAPIVSYRPRRLIFIPTTFEKFETASQINDLFDDSPLENRLWNALKYIGILAERQWKVVIQEKKYFLDFAIFCNNGKLAIETDGYTYHHDSKAKIDYDTWRRNDMELDDWRALHYTTKQVKDNWTPYLSQIEQKIAQLGGLENPENFERKVGDDQGKYITDSEEPL
ncbi:DUF559 domain-containing protein [Candidatus Villigracilis saccharophilus]|uniref:endonuclease domain-containing protein n=1 Tax=Candidatus Villigracilis saccharophilus TaxID=3140684 RepID=UPI003135F443|nr:DUF559 domain-containing protein [Anaerolineales bacterium]